MDNYLLLESNEKRVVNAKRFNFVAKCLFPVDIRVLDEYGVERDRFSNVTSGFSFELGRQGLWKLEITNGDFGQDVRVFSGDYPIYNKEEFTKIYKIMVFQGASSGYYSVIQIKNKSKKSIKISVFSTTSTFHRFYYYNISDFGTKQSEYIIKDYNNDNIDENIEIISCLSASQCTNSQILYSSITGDKYNENVNFLLPSNLSLLMNSYAVNNTITDNVTIFV